jgi:hypothetical protein
MNTLELRVEFIFCYIDKHLKAIKYTCSTILKNNRKSRLIKLNSCKLFHFVANLISTISFRLSHKQANKEY